MASNGTPTSSPTSTTDPENNIAIIDTNVLNPRSRSHLRLVFGSPPEFQFSRLAVRLGYLDIPNDPTVIEQCMMKHWEASVGHPDDKWRPPSRNADPNYPLDHLRACLLYEVLMGLEMVELGEDNKECVICREELFLKREERKAEKAGMLICCHNVVGMTCLGKWLSQKQSCIFCRKDLHL